MNQELQDKLRERFPQLFQELGKEGSCMYWGLCVNDGWFELLWRLCTDLEQLDPSLVASQVKEKFGTLRFYLRQSDLEMRHEAAEIFSFAPQANDERVRARIRQAEQESAGICDKCGAPGKLRRGNYHHVSCDACQATINAGYRLEFGAQWDQQRERLLRELAELGAAAVNIRAAYDQGLQAVAAGDAEEQQLASHVEYLLKRCRKLKQKLARQPTEGGEHE